MVLRNLSRMQFDSGDRSPQRRILHNVILLAPLLAFFVLGCNQWAAGIYRSTTSDRVIEFRSGTAYITEGHSRHSVPYEITGDKVVLKLPFMNEVLQRMPDGTLSGMGETLAHIDDATALLLGTYESREGEYKLRLNTEGRAIYTRLGRSIEVSYTVSGNQITLNQGTIRIFVKLQPDGSLETPDAVLRKQT